MALAALALILTVAATAQGPLVVRSSARGEVAAISLVARAPDSLIPPSQCGATALLGEMLTLRMSRALAGEEGVLARAMPADRGVEVGFEPDYIAVTVAVVRSALPQAVHFLRRIAVEAPFDPTDLDAARENVLKRQDAWAAEVVQHTTELMLQALSGGRVGRPLYGSAENIKSFTVDQINSLWRRMLETENVCISMEGDRVTGDPELDAALDALVAALPSSGETTVAPRPSWRPRNGVKVEDNPNIARASLVVGFSVEPFGKPGYWAARALREVLAGPSGTLVRDRTLASKLGLVLPAGLGWQDWPLEALSIEVSATPYLAIHAVTDPAAIHVAAEGIVQHVKALADGKLTDRELQRARRRVVNQWARETARVSDRTLLRAVAALLGEELPDPRQVAGVVGSLRASDLQAVAKDMLRNVAVGVQMPRA